MVENREKKSSSIDRNDSSQAGGQAQVQSRPQSQQQRRQPSDLIQRRPRLNAEEETRRRNERANELRLKNRSNRIR